MSPTLQRINAVVEGILDEAVLGRLLRDEGLEIGTVLGRDGKGFIRKNLNGFNRLAADNAWLVLVDLDNEADCAPALLKSWSVSPNRYMCFRIAVREVESWLLADREGLSGFLSVNLDLIPPYPEQETDPKRTLVEIAGHSRRREIRQAIVPRPGSGRATGPLYDSTLIQFVSTNWRPHVAAEFAPSLASALNCVRGKLC